MKQLVPSSILLLVCIFFFNKSFCFTPILTDTFTIVRDFECAISGVSAIQPCGFDETGVGEYIITNSRSHTGSNCAEINMIQGTEAITAGINKSIFNIDGKEGWLQWYLQVTPGFSWDEFDTNDGAATLKLHRFHKVPNDNLNGSTGYTSAFITHDEGAPLIDNEFPTIRVHQATPLISINQPNHWYQISFYVKWSASGQGIMKLWVDGKLIVEVQNVSNLDDTNRAWLRTLIFGNWNGGVPQNQTAYVDDIMITNVNPNWSFNNDCDEDHITKDNNIGSGTYKAAESINASGTIVDSAAVTFTAGLVINFNPGFNAPNGVNFHASIKPCNTLPNPLLLCQQNPLGGSGDEFSLSSAPTSDGGKIICGRSSSNDGDIAGDNNGGNDFWVAKLEASGILTWAKSYGGSSSDYPFSIIQTIDGGFLIGGHSYSNNGDVNGNKGQSDLWVLKLNASGNISWENNFGGSSDEEARKVIQSPDGSYLVVGWSKSSNGDVSGNFGDADYWLIKLDVNGNKLWDEHFGGTSQDIATSFLQLPDGGYIISGHTQSDNQNVGDNYGGSDYWIIRLDASRNIIWENNFGGSGDDFVQKIIATNDGGFLLVGYSNSTDQDRSSSKGGNDAWAVKIDSNGQLVWEQAYGGAQHDEIRDVIELNSSYFVAVGRTASSDQDVTSLQGSFDVWVLNISPSGDLVWQKTFGGSAEDMGTSISLWNDAFFIGANTKSNDGDVSGLNGDRDFWVISLKEDCIPAALNLKNNPNPSPTPTLTLNCYPNPFSSNFTIEYELVEPTNGYLAIYHNTGLLIKYIKIDTSTEKGKYSLGVDGPTFSPGAYFVVFRDKKRIVRKKLIMIR